MKLVFAGASQQSAQWMNESSDFERWKNQLLPVPLAICMYEMEVAAWKSKLVPQPFQDPHILFSQP
jgi:hypothetical protein